jgi:hypothetical protein
MTQVLPPTSIQEPLFSNYIGYLLATFVIVANRVVGYNNKHTLEFISRFNLNLN